MLRWGVIFIAAGWMSHAMTASAEPIALGWVENAIVDPGGVRLKAKLDTGALTSSLSVEDLEAFEKAGEPWVRFRIVVPGRRVIVERPVLRTLRIRRAGAAVRRRYVVKVRICVGSVSKEAEVSLADRSRMNYPLLIGRRFMTGVIMVDPSRTFTTRPSCRNPEPTGNKPQDERGQQ